MNKLKFKRSRTLDEFKAVCKKRKWEFSDKLYKRGDDRVSALWKVGKHRGMIAFAPHNGSFVGSMDGWTKPDGDPILIGDGSTELDNVPWYRSLLTACFVITL